MTLSDLHDTVEVSVNFMYLLRRLTEAQKTNDVVAQDIINRAIYRLNMLSLSETKLPFEPPMSVKEAKEIFPNYEVCPPPLRLFTTPNT